MLTAGQKFSLMCMYMRPVLIASGIVSLVMFLALISVDPTLLRGFAIIISFFKMLILAMCIALFLIMRTNASKFFYINLGVPVKKLLLWGICFDLGIYYICLTIILIARYGIC